MTDIQYVQCKNSDGFKGKGYNVFYRDRFIGEVWRHIPGIDCTDKDLWCWKGTNINTGVRNRSIGGGATRKIATEKLKDWVFYGEKISQDVVE